MVWLNMPHVWSQGLMVILVTVVSMWMHTGMIQQTDIESLCEYMTDDSWSAWDPDECKEPSSCPYYCMCARWDGSAWDTIENGKKPFAIESDGAWISHARPAEVRTHAFGYDAEGSNVQTVDYETQPKGWTVWEWMGRTPYERHFQTADPPVWPLSTVSGEKPLHVSTGVQIIEGHIAAGKLPEDPAKRAEFLEFKKTAPRLDSTNCMTHGLVLGRSVSFITAVMCEMLRAYTVRSLQPAHQVWNRNWIMHFACLSSFLLTVSLTFIPGVKELFKLDAPEWFYYGVAFCFAFGSATIDEFLKWVYRRVLVKRELGDKAAIERKAIKERVDMVVEMVHDVERSVEKNNEIATESRHALGKVKQEIVTILQDKQL